MRRAIPALGRTFAACLVLYAFDAASGTPGLQWSDTIGSPRPLAPTSTRDRELTSVCPDGDSALRTVAAQLAAHTVAADDVEAITYALRAAGDPHVWPRAFLLEGKSVDLVEAKARMKTWLGTFRQPARLRCGIVLERSGDKEVVAAIAIDAQADLASMPVRARTSSWVDIDAKVLAPASGAKVIVLGPTGAPRTLLTSFSEGRVKARANVDRDGTWLFQVLLDGVNGPRPVLEAYVFAGIEPPGAQPSRPAPGEEAGGAGDGAMALGRMMMLARRSETLPGLVRDGALDRIARSHAERMMRMRQLGHDVGDGDPKDRLERAGISLPQVGENVAHAANIVLAHRALWSSPSHRDNLLQPRFDRVGIGVSTDPDGSVWVTELFGTSPRDPPLSPASRPR
ncbi:MAG TPA: CAP domain-containing protein [Polyangiaceae bacterium]|nr:CAP domain-containing protein [Polyangiaceae bacterium]